MSKEPKHPRNGCVEEPSPALTYGMSEELRNSDLLWRIRDLNLEDKTCLIRYIQHDINEEQEREDDFWGSIPAGIIGPKTQEEAIERAKAATERYQRGEILSAEEVRTQLKERFEWL